MTPAPEVVIETPDATEPATAGLPWVQSPVDLDRRHEYWLGAQEDEFVLLSWRSPFGGLAIRRSIDGLAWTEQIPLVGLPEYAQPIRGWWPSQVMSASSAGLIGLFDTTPSIDGPWGLGVFASDDGVVWREEQLPTDDAGSGRAEPTAVAASDSGVAVLAFTELRNLGTAVLFVRPVDGAWRPVEIPGSGYASESWVAPSNDGFVVRIAEGPEANEGAHPVYRVDIEGNITADATPTDQPPIRWVDSLVTYSPYNNVPQPSLYAGPDGHVWYRLPTPDFTTDDEGKYWSIDAVTAGRPGITVAGCPCGEYWGFLGEAWVTIEIDTGTHHVTVHGDQVSVDDIAYDQERVETSAWFNHSTGTLSIPDPETGNTIATVTCDEMRASARNKMYQPDLLTPPPQDLLYSPDGTSWTHQYVNDLFGIGSYIDQASTLNDTIVVMVDPTGDAPTPNPPGCPLGIYPETEPYEIWTAIWHP